MRQSLEDELTDGLQQLGMDVQPDTRDKLIDYILLLSKWNKTHNLTAIRDVQEMVRRHLLDSLSIAPYIDAPALLDVGAGAGLPGIPIGIVKPHVNVTLVDSVVKKTRFMQFAAAELSLSNIEPLHERVQNLPADPGFPIVVARAFSSIDKLCQLTAHLVSPNGKILAMTGRPLDAQHTDPNQLAGFKVVKEEKLFVPGETAERNIVVLQHSA